MWWIILYDLLLFWNAGCSLCEMVWYLSLFPPPWSLVSRFVSAKINENAGMEDDLDENITFDNFDDDDEDDIDDI